MSSFNGRQIEMLVDAFWNLHAVQCPNDGAKLQARLYSQLAGYLLVLGCPKCGPKAQVTQYSDPKRAAFRMWTQTEGGTLALGHQSGKNVNCPVCQARVKHRIVGQLIHVFECPRCGNQHDVLSLDQAIEEVPSFRPIPNPSETYEQRTNNGHASNHRIAQIA